MVSEKILSKIEENVARVMIGKKEVTRLLLAAIAAGGHVLLEDVPGTGKTVLAKALAKSMGCKFDRVQFTPDLLPSDVTGLSFFNQEKAAFTFKQGPVFTNILLADEINRATPRTQSSLLECMAEGQVTVDGETRMLEAPFFVIATQNPVETIGCFPLPEAQLDRFIAKIHMGSLTGNQKKQCGSEPERNPGVSAYGTGLCARAGAGVCGARGYQGGCALRIVPQADR